MVLLMPCFAIRAQDTTPITIKFKKSDLEGKDAMLSEMADEISYIKLETHPDAIIGSSSRYYVNQIPQGFLFWSIRGGKIFLFNSDGTFRGIVGSEGKGPGEHYGVYKVRYDKYLDNILVLLYNKVLRYDMDGKFLFSVEIDKNNGRVEQFCVKDDKTWLFTYKKPLKEDFFEVGILATNKDGEIVKKYDLTDDKSPGSYSYHTQLNYVYQINGDSYYTPYDFYKSYKLNNDDQWVPYVIIDAPFKKIPIGMFKGHNPMELSEIQNKNGFLIGGFVQGDFMKIRGNGPPIFNTFVNLDSKEILYYSHDKRFHLFGFNNDIDGGIPIELRGAYTNGISLNMIDAIKLLDYSKNGLLNPDGKDHGPYMNLAEVLESTKPEDNPILIVVRLKNQKN